MRIYDYLDEIRRALNAEESSGVPTPSWRIEEYLKDIYDAIQSGVYPSDEQVAEAINAWLDDHPEATTTVQDGSITNAKLASSFVTPGTAAAYSSSAKYAVGDYVFYGGTLYRCTTAITTAEAWTAAHWTAAVLGEDVGDLKSALEDVGGYDSLYIPEWEQGNITVSDYALVYSDGTTRCRFIEDITPIFVPGTKIEVTDPVYRFSYYYSGADGKWYGQSDKTEHTVLSSNSRYALVVRRTDWHVILPDEASSAIKITLPFSQYKRNTESFYKTFSVADYLTDAGMFFASGNGLAAGSTASKVSNFIPVSSGMVINYDLSQGTNTGRYVICVYDDEFNFLNGVEGIGSGTITIATDGYVRFANLNNYDGYAYFNYDVPDKIQVEIDKINSTLTDNVTGTDYMQSALDRINGELKAKSVLGNIVTFGFSTDQHIKDDNDATATLPVLRGLKVLSKLTQAYPYDFICLGGDACEAGSYATTLNRILDECITIQKPLYDAWCPVVPLTGNHDAAQNNNTITGGMLFNAHFKRVANSGFIDGWDSTHTNGYWDSEAHKIRFIFFDDTTRADYTSEERNTVLSEMVSGTPEGYNMVILSHHPLSQSLTDSHWQNPVYADDILTPYASRIICCICGHSHADISETQNGILYIATTLAMYGYDQDAQRGTLNTETETAFDTFVIDQTNKHIYAIRYGHGENRDWAYTLT